MQTYVCTGLWLLLRFCDPGEHGATEDYRRGWRDGVEAAARSLGVDPIDFERLNALDAFTEQGRPCSHSD